eukprot:SAG22_NODE_358_length_11759_cov_39.384563_4_plen_790_part_00
MVTAAFLICAGGGAAQKVDISQLRGLDVPEGLQQFLGAMVTEMRGMEEENAKLQKEQNRTRAVEVELRQENAVVRAELEHVKKDKEALENKTRVMEAESVAVREALENKTQIIEGQLFTEKKYRMQLSIEVTEVRSALYRFSNKTNTDYTSITVRLDQCEADATPFIQEMNRRRAQATDHCHGTGMQTMLVVCCPDGGGGGHRRELQSGHGCAAFPDTCSVACSAIFNEFYEDCHESMIASMPAAEQADFDSFYGACTEAAQQAAAALEGASPAMIFHVVVVDQEAEQQVAMANGGGGSGSDPSQFGPVNLPPTPSPSSDAGGAVAAKEFRRVCTTVNLATCVPECNAVTYGFLLSIEIDGRGTVMTCNKMGLLFSWQGQAALGGYIGDDFQAFFSSVVSGAAGTYMSKLMANANINTDLTIQPGQVVVVGGDKGLAVAPSWGSGGFTVQQFGSLSLTSMALTSVIEILSGGHASFDSSTVRPHIDAWGSPVDNTILVTGGSVTMRNSLLAADMTISDGGTVLIATTVFPAVPGHSHGFSGLFPQDPNTQHFAIIRLRSGAQLRLDSLEVPYSILRTLGVLQPGFDPVGLSLNEVTVPEFPSWGELTGKFNLTIESDGFVTVAAAPPGFVPAGPFTVLVDGNSQYGAGSTCSVSDDGRCVSYDSNSGCNVRAEDCTYLKLGCMIDVGGGGVISSCPQWNVGEQNIQQTLAQGLMINNRKYYGGPVCERQVQAYDNSPYKCECPIGEVLMPGTAISWRAYSGNGEHDRGGTWQICFEEFTQQGRRLRATP